MLSKIATAAGTAAIYVGHFVAGGLGFSAIISTIVGLVELLWGLVSLIWAHSASDQAHLQGDLKQLAISGAALILLVIGSEILSRITEHTRWEYLIYGLAVGVLFAIGKFTFMSASWTDSLFGKDGLSAAALLILGGFGVRLVSRFL